MNDFRKRIIHMILSSKLDTHRKWQCVSFILVQFKPYFLANSLCKIYFKIVRFLEIANFSIPVVIMMWAWELAFCPYYFKRWSYFLDLHCQLNVVPNAVVLSWGRVNVCCRFSTSWFQFAITDSSDTCFIFFFFLISKKTHMSSI